MVGLLLLLVAHRNKISFEEAFKAERVVPDLQKISDWKHFYFLFENPDDSFRSVTRDFRGLYFGPKTIFIPPPPFLKMIIFPPLTACCFSTPIVAFLP
jgi:hypothetical protein